MKQEIEAISQIAVQEVYKGLKKKEVFFITEIIQFIILVMGGIMLLWLYAPFSLVIKGIITMIATLITVDIFKNFIYTRWIMYKEEKQ